MNNNINCVPNYINTKENIIADKISRSNHLFATDIEKLLHKHIELQQCKHYQVSPAFLLCLTQALLNGQSPPLGQLPKPGHRLHDRDISSFSV